MSRAGALLFIFLLSILDVVPCFSQPKARFSGEQSIGDKVFDTNIEFYESGGDTVYHGAFKLSKRGPEYGEEVPFNFLTIQGNYEDGVPQNRWKLQVGSFIPVGTSSYADYKLEFKVDGEELNASGRVKDGLKHGDWELSDWVFERSVLIDTLLQTKLSFEEDKLVGSILIGSSDKRLIGRLGTEQEPEGTWVYMEEDATGKYHTVEEWVFSDQRLASRTHYADGNDYSITYNYDDLEPDSWEWHKINENYFELYDLVTSIEDSPFNQHFSRINGLEDFYKRFLSKLTDLDAAMIEGFAFFGFETPVRVKVPLYEYSKSDARSLKRIKRNYQDTKRLIEETTNDTQVLLASISSEEVLRFKEVLLKIDNTLMPPLAKLLRYDEVGHLEHVNRQAYAQKNFDFNNTLMVQLGEDESTWKFEHEISNVEIDADAGPLDQVQQWSDGLLVEARSIVKRIEAFLSELKKEEKLLEQESEFIKKYNRLEVAVDSLLNDGHDEVAGFDIQKPLKKFLSAELTKYSRLEGIEGREERLQDMMMCFNEFDTLLHTLERSRDNYFAMKDEYTRQVFNAYTFTYMEEIAKPSLMRATKRILLPAVYDNLNSLNCDNIREVNNNFERLFTGVRELRREETRTKERKLRRMQDPREVSDLLELKLVFY